MSRDVRNARLTAAVCRRYSISDSVAGPASVEMRQRQWWRDHQLRARMISGGVWEVHTRIRSRASCGDMGVHIML